MGAVKKPDHAAQIHNSHWVYMYHMNNPFLDYILLFPYLYTKVGHAYTKTTPHRYQGCSHYDHQQVGFCFHLEALWYPQKE